MFATNVFPSATGVMWERSSGKVLSAAFVVGAGILLGISVGAKLWVVVAAMFVLPLVLRWPVQISLGLFSLLLPFEAVFVLGDGGNGMTLTFLVGGASTVILIVTGLANDRFTSPPRAALWWTLFILWGIGTALWALDERLSVQRIPTALAFLLMFVTAASIRITVQELSWIESCAIGGGAAAAVFSAIQFYSGVFYHGAESMRGSMILGEHQEDPNQFALTLLLPIALAIGRFFSTQNRIGKALLATVTGVIILGLFLTMSRGVIFALAILLVFFFYKERVGWRILVPVCTLLLLGSLLLPTLFFERLRGSMATHGAGRFDIWIAAIQGVWQHGLFGAGLDNFSTAYSTVAGAAPNFVGYSIDSHNTYLGMLVELGSIGFLCFLFALRTQLRAASRVSQGLGGSLRHRLLSYQAACYGILAAGMSLDVVWRKPFWLCWALLASATSLARQATGTNNMTLHHPSVQS